MQLSSTSQNDVWISRPRPAATIFQANAIVVLSTSAAARPTTRVTTPYLRVARRFDSDSSVLIGSPIPDISESRLLAGLRLRRLRSCCESRTSRARPTDRIEFQLCDEPSTLSFRIELNRESTYASTSESSILAFSDDEPTNDS